MRKGVFRHNNITTTEPAKAESTIGWTAHYLTGVVFAAALLMLVGSEWISAPSVVPAVAFGIVTVGFPFFLMQPGMGFGIAASKAPNPNVARFRSVLTHGIFGLGLYFSATLMSLFFTH